MRLGDYTCAISEGSLAERVYGSREIVERHRHRYEVNQQYRDALEQSGLRITGLSPDGRLVEMLEHASNDYFIATQAHPEFRSRPNRAHPLFDGFIAAAKERVAGQRVNAEL
jgi:CTP synthase